MSVLEIKGSIYDSISKINDSSVLRQLYDIISEITEAKIDKVDFWDNISSSQKKEIDKALNDSKNEQNLISNNIVMGKYKKWINK